MVSSLLALQSNQINDANIKEAMLAGQNRVQSRDFFGIPATGKTATVEGSTIARMKNGIIIEEQDFFDNLDLLTQLGLYP